MDVVYINELYDYYGNLLTDKQRMYFEDYYFNNLTLSEMSENYNISRNAIHKQLKDVQIKLENFEQNLKLLEKKKKINKIIEKIDDEKIKEQLKELI